MAGHSGFGAAVHISHCLDVMGDTPIGLARAALLTGRLDTAHTRQLAAHGRFGNSVVSVRPATVVSVRPATDPWASIPGRHTHTASHAPNRSRCLPDASVSMSSHSVGVQEQRQPTGVGVSPTGDCFSPTGVSATAWAPNASFSRRLSRVFVETLYWMIWFTFSSCVPPLARDSHHHVLFNSCLITGHACWPLLQTVTMRTWYYSTEAIATHQM